MGPEAGLIGAVDIGGTKIAVGLVTAGGTVVVRREMNTSDSPNGAAAADNIACALHSCLQEIDCELQGVGIACTGPIDPLTGTIGKVANLPGWENYGLGDALARRFGVGVVMENDADAAALAEYRWGSGNGSVRFVYITLSTGIGAGIILDGKLYRGKNGSHPELGHHTIDASGPPCYCGANGCWESLASGLGLRRWYLEKAGRPTADPGFGAKEIFALHDSGDALAQEAVARLSRYVGIGLANIVTMFVPDRIALGGGLTARADAFLPAAEQLLRRSCGEVPSKDIAIHLASLRDDTGLAGGVAAWLLRRQS